MAPRRSSLGVSGTIRVFRRIGGVIGQPLTVEGVVSFFPDTAFLGLSSSAEGKQLLATAKLNNNARKVPRTTTRRMS
jgi:hypothetical protein